MGGRQRERKTRQQGPPGSTARGRGRINPQGGQGKQPRNRKSRDQTPDEIKASILRLIEHGFPRGLAARRAGIDPRTAERWRAADPEFAAAVELAETVATDEVENALFRAAVVELNVTAQQVWLYNRNAERWKDKRSLNATVQISDEEARSLDERLAEVVVTLISETRKTREAEEENAAEDAAEAEAHSTELPDEGAQAS